MRRTALLLACILAAASIAAAGARADPIDTGREPDCTEAVPTVLSHDFSQPIDLEVLVLLDGVSQATAEHAMSMLTVPYGPLGIRLHPHYETAPAVASDDPVAVLDYTRDALGGRRPDGIHLVYVMTSKNLVSSLTGSSVAGMSDCIGGIAFADRGFAVGEVDDSPYDELGLFGETTAKIEGHELGHLLGGQHHYANCFEAPVDNADRGGCTLLINDVGLAELKFSTLNAAVIRGHAEVWSRRTPGTYDPVPGKPAEKPASQPAPSGGSPPAPTAEPSSTASGPRASAKPTLACRKARTRLRHAAAALRSARRAHRRAHTAAGRRRTARRMARRRAEHRRARRAATRACAMR